jgi:hypothetical protein
MAASLSFTAAEACDVNEATETPKRFRLVSILCYPKIPVSASYSRQGNDRFPLPQASLRSKLATLNKR